MTDLISRQAAISALKEHFSDDDGIAVGEYWKHEEVVGVLEKRPSVGGWIPCKKRMPELNDDRYVSSDGRYRSDPVLVTYISVLDGKPYTAEETAIWRDDDCWYWGDSENGIDDDVKVKIIAWMPLPEAYKEGKQ